MNADAQSRGLLERLVRIGAIIDRTARSGATAEIDADEKANLEKSLENAYAVRAYIETRRELVSMVAAVMDRVRNPRDDA